MSCQGSQYFHLPSHILNRNCWCHLATRIRTTWKNNNEQPINEQYKILLNMTNIQLSMNFQMSRDLLNWKKKKKDNTNKIVEANQDVKNQSSPKGYKKPFTYPLKKRSLEILKDTSYQIITLFAHPSVLLQVHHIFYSFLILFKRDLKVICCLAFHQMLPGLTWTSF